MLILRCLKRSAHYQFITSSCVLPHYSKVDKGGEDALFASKFVLGVADGVGSWSSSGIDPGLYSKELMTLVQRHYLHQPQHYRQNLKQLFVNAVRDNQQCATSTFSLLSLWNNKLLSCYLGDSVFLVARNGKLLLKASNIQHRENCPFQVGVASGGDDPQKAKKEETEVEPGDIVVLASDGLWDNMADQQIVEMAGQFRSDLAERIAKKCRRYYMKIERQKVQHRSKPDDIAVVCARVIA